MSDFKNDLKVLQDNVNQLVDNYISYTDDFNTEYVQNIAAAIYLEYKRLYPDLDIFIPFRSKGPKSFQKNISKGLFGEIKKNNGQIIFNPEKEESCDKISKDIIAMKIILSHIPNVLSFDYNNPENKEIIKLQNQKISNLNFINELTDWLNNNSDNLVQDEEHFYKYYIELLKRLQKSTYEECSDELEITYKERYERATEQYNKKKENDEFSFLVSDEQISELNKLLRMSRK